MGLEKHLRAVPVLTAMSEHIKAIAHMDTQDTKEHEDSQSKKDAEHVKRMTDAITIK